MLTIVIPAYNEEKRIPATLESYGGFFLEKEKKRGLKTKILVVINNSSDNTLGVVENYHKKFKNITYLNLIRGGKGYATVEGFKEALRKDSDFIGFVDADMATSPEAFYDLYKNIGKAQGIIASRWKNGAKVKRSSGKLFRSKGFNILTRFLFLFPYQDTQCGAKIFRKNVVKEIVDNLESAEWAFDVNILYLCKVNKFKIKEHPTIWEDKEGSKITSIKVPIKMAGGVIRLRLLKSPFKVIVRAYDKFLAKIIKMHNLI